MGTPLAFFGGQANAWGYLGQLTLMSSKIFQEKLAVGCLKMNHDPAKPLKTVGKLIFNGPRNFLPGFGFYRQRRGLKPRPPNKEYENESL